MKLDIDFWPRLVLNEGDIPVSFKAFFEKIYTPQTSFPYTVFALPDKWSSGKAIPKLVCLFQDRIYVAEKINKQIKSTCFVICHINYIEMASLLLYSWLKIEGVVDNQLTTVTVEFNTVVQELFKPIVEKTRLLINHIEPSEGSKIQLQQEQQKFNYLSRENYKYMNYGKYSLLPGCKVHQILLQPDIRVKFLKFFKRTLSFVHQTILTDNELITIKDTNGMKMTNGARYGGIWRYIPLHKINKLELTGNPQDGLYTLCIHLSGNGTICSLFSAALKSQLDSLQSEFKLAKRTSMQVAGVLM